MIWWAQRGAVSEASRQSTPLWRFQSFLATTRWIITYLKAGCLVLLIQRVNIEAIGVCGHKWAAFPQGCWLLIDLLLHHTQGLASWHFVRLSCHTSIRWALLLLSFTLADECFCSLLVCTRTVCLLLFDRIWNDQIDKLFTAFFAREAKVSKACLALRCKYRCMHRRWLLLLLHRKSLECMDLCWLSSDYRSYDGMLVLYLGLRLFSFFIGV